MSKINGVQDSEINPFDDGARVVSEFQEKFLSGFINKLVTKMESKMLGQSCNKISAPMYEKEYQDRYNRSVWDDLIFAIQLLKNFDEELKKLHPDVTHRIRQLMN